VFVHFCEFERKEKIVVNLPNIIVIDEEIEADSQHVQHVRCVVCQKVLPIEKAIFGSDGFFYCWTEWHLNLIPIKRG
jgi:hypothetical protein